MKYGVNNLIVGENTILTDTVSEHLVLFLIDNKVVSMLKTVQELLPTIIAFSLSWNMGLEISDLIRQEIPGS